MTLRHLEIFKAVSETKSFTRAAARLYITQSAVSHAIRELEEQAGTPLFDRLSKSVYLTRSGELLMQEIIPILSACSLLESHIGHLETQAPIRVVSSITIANFFLPALLRDFYGKYPDTSVQVEVLRASSAMETLRQGKADIALIEGGLPQDPFRSLVFGSCRLKVVCAPDYPVSHTVMSVEEFCAEKLLLREKGSAIRDTLDSALYLLGYTAHPHWCSVNSSALIAAAKAGLGIAVLADALVEDDLAQKHLRNLTVAELALKNDLVAVWHRDKFISGPLSALLSLIRDSKS